MKKDVIITIRGLQQYEEVDSDSIELVTEGCFYQKGETYYATYRESALTGLGDTTTTMKFEPNRVTVIRFGDTHTHLVFEEGQKHLSYYDMGFGSLTVGVSTQQIRKSLSACGGQVEIDYSMEINHALAGENAFCVHIREADAVQN